MLGNLESIVESYLDKTPFIAKMYFGHELSVLKKSLEESKKLRENYVPSEQWYINYALNLNKGFDAVYNATDRAYATYDAIKYIPIIGKPLCSIIDKYIGDAIGSVMPASSAKFDNEIYNKYAKNTPKQISIPQKTTTLKMVENIGLLGIEAVCAHYEFATGKSADNIRSQVQYRPTLYTTDPSPFRRGFINALESIGNFFNEMFGVKYNATPG